MPRPQASVLDAAGDLEVVASTSERSRLVELMQLRAGEGPCMESVATGHAVSVGDIDSVSPRWPQFRLGTLEQGFTAVHAVPLRLREEVIGSLNLFWDAPGALEIPTRRWRRRWRMSRRSASCTAQVRESDVARDQLQHALDSRVVIEQAKGVIAQTHGTAPHGFGVRDPAHVRAGQPAHAGWSRRPESSTEA